MAVYISININFCTFADNCSFSTACISGDGGGGGGGGGGLTTCLRKLSRSRKKDGRAQGSKALLFLASVRLSSEPVFRTTLYDDYMSPFLEILS